MTNLKTVQTWKDAGILLAVVDYDRLRVTGPMEQMTADLRSLISNHKTEIIRLLAENLPEIASQYENWTDEELLEFWQERAAIMEYYGGLSRENADEASKQWLISLIGVDRFTRIACIARSAHDSMTCTTRSNES